ncbi:hypothetical protein GCM10009504_01310 [Pseudomonas laurentiana]|uniref:DUF1826 domain-containing protein n=1 Tax=Pseudomonas laurentiana TaxID=2364649 RepID=A0A6I5RNQ4_9PSED|nr:DUF1826 domain-containing protein [Pseudomonas laurentiana]NES09340.1 DUF1826 domain-containing protein [Pseudomonas laurentiana]GGU48770.1 hypothetical protein GCM10009504_01310 [Pseudomonas laurentiana]
MLAMKPRNTPRQVLGESPQVLAEALQDGVNLAAWERQLPVQVADFASLLLSLNQPLAESFTLELGDDGQLPVLPTLARGYADLAGYDGFVADVAWLVSAYACLLDARRVGVRLTVLDNAMCPRWHVDHVPLRLLTTYAGPGSEWLEEAVDKRVQPLPAEVEPSRVRQLACGAVALLKGEKWLGNEGSGLIHRSPALANGERRLILSLDWMA